MIFTDYHMHTDFSSDSDASMQDMIEAAIRQSLTHICFTEHMDKDFILSPPEYFTFEVDTDAYYRRFIELKEQYQEKITICFGIELGLQPHVADFYKTYVKGYPFDFIIASSHLCHRLDPYYPSFYQGRSEEEAYLEYFDSILENIAVFDDFDTYGHLDYVVRYGPNKNQYYSYDKYKETLDLILKELIAKDKALEVNTGGFVHGLGHPNPTEEIITRFSELGGRYITIGSDAHTPKNICCHFEKLPELLKSCGISEYTYYTKRQPHQLKLS